MPAARTLLIMLVPVAAAAGEVRLLFTGDILLDRGVRTEIERTGRSPWDPWSALFRKAHFVVGNLEGALGDARACEGPRRLCFAAPPAYVELLRRAGFHALGLANNHAGDLGAAGLDETQRVLREAGLAPLTFEGSPHLVALGELSLALVAFNQIPGRAATLVRIPSVELRQKLRLARRLAHLVVVYVHWGAEYATAPSVAQRRAATWLIEQGADAVIGHHPHVVQRPECVSGKPVFYSLGNHVFDQRTPGTKEGLLAECRFLEGVAHFRALATRTPPRSTFPHPAGDDAAANAVLAGCPVRLREPVRVGEWQLRGASKARGIVLTASAGPERRWQTRPLPLLAVEAAPFAQDGSEPLVLTLEKRYSTLDGEWAPRPYVYRISERGPVAVWRGSALAWPLADAAVLEDGTLCALHRADSFAAPEPRAPAGRVAADRWNGFGFTGVEDEATEQSCQVLFQR